MTLPVVFVHGRPWGRDVGLRRAEQKILWIAGLWTGLEAAGHQEIPLSRLAIADYQDHLEAYASRMARDDVRALADSIGRDLEAAESDVGGTPAAHAPPEAVCPHCRPRREVPEWTPSKLLSQAAGRPAASRILFLFPDIAAYLVIEEFRRTVREEVARTVARHAPCVLVAHSLGALAALDHLAVNGRSGVRALVTVGSPAAIPALRADVGERIALRREEIAQVPWLNVVNPYDGITGGFLSSPPEFPPSVRNLVVANRGEPHNVGRYLAHPPVGGFVARHAQVPRTPSQAGPGVVGPGVAGPGGPASPGSAPGRPTSAGQPQPLQRPSHALGEVDPG